LQLRARLVRAEVNRKRGGTANADSAAAILADANSRGLLLIARQAGNLSGK
jgi:hypothetical protein